MVARVALLAAEIVSDPQTDEFRRSDETVVFAMCDERKRRSSRSEAQEENAGAEERAEMFHRGETRFEHTAKLKCSK